MYSMALEEVLVPPSTLFSHPPFLNLSQSLSEVQQSQPEHFSSTSLQMGIKWLDTLQRQIEALKLNWLAEADRRASDSSVDPLCVNTLWLQDKLQLTSTQAYSQLRLARKLAELPKSKQALEQGEISSQQAGVICQAMEQLGKVNLAEQSESEIEGQLLRQAREMDPKELLAYWNQLRYQMDQQAGVRAEESQHQRRWLNYRQLWSGNYRIEGELDAEGGSMLKSALKTLMAKRPANDERTPAQRRADALTELARRQLNAGELPEQGGEKPQLMVVAELSTLQLESGSQLAELDWGAAISGESARRIGCDASVIPVLKNRQGDVLHVGNASRSTSPRLRRALNLRDRHCQWPGCDIPARECDSHHERHWADGGVTTLENLRLLCPYHHRQRHPENHRFYQYHRGPP